MGPVCFCFRKGRAKRPYSIFDHESRIDGHICGIGRLAVVGKARRIKKARAIAEAFYS